MSYVIQRSKDRKEWKHTGYAFAQRTNARRHMAIQKRLFPEFSYRVFADGKSKMPALEKAVVKVALEWWRERTIVTREKAFVQEEKLDAACAALDAAKSSRR